MSTQHSSNFEMLHEHVQKWVYDSNWSSLRAAQEEAIPLLLGADRDVLLSAATAGGKTEAAFLPIVSSLLSQDAKAGVQALYVAPLKALINDQFDRLSDLCEGSELAVHKWHGDVPAAHKRRLLGNPSGILLTTPESLEALFVLRGPQLPALFKNLRYVVIDELHAFLGTERGAQLLSQLHRLEMVTKRRVARVGLSATLGDMGLAAAQLRPAAPDSVTLLSPPDGGRDLRIGVRGYVRRAPLGSGSDRLSGSPSRDEVVTGEVAEHLFTVTRGSDNLVFANSRGQVEIYADKLREICESRGLAAAYFPHHGNLSREMREGVEASLKDPAKPTTAVATSTLEMGIDIGSVSSVAQVGAPPSVAALRQRIGRSGRRGEAAILRSYCVEDELKGEPSLEDQLRTGLVQSVAMLELLLEGWCEPPQKAVLHTSTLVQQLLSLVAQHGGVTPQQAYQALCSGAGPFSGTSPARFGAVLRALGVADVLEQDPDGTLLIGRAGEFVVNHYSFYAVFKTPDEYRLLTKGRQLGTLPIDFPLQVGEFLIFGGRRWSIVGVDEEKHTVDLLESRGGKAPLFLGSVVGVAGTVHQKMRSVLSGSEVPAYLDPIAASLLEDARANFKRLGLADKELIERGKECLLLPWAGTTVLATLGLQLSRAGLEVVPHRLVLVCEASAQEVTRALEEIASAPPFDAVVLAQALAATAQNKYDHWLSPELLAEDYAAHSLDTAGSKEVAQTLLTKLRPAMKAERSSDDGNRDDA